MKKIKIILYLIFSISFIILILEIGLRSTGKLKTYSEKNFGVYQSPYAVNSKGYFFKEKPLDTIYTFQKEFEYTYFLNDLGLNNKLHIKELDNKDSYLFLGDSFTFGVGAPQDSSLPALLSNFVNCNFINAGFSGSDPFYEKKLIDSIFAPQGFHNYIIMLNFSDLYDYIFRGGNERFLKNGTVVYSKAPSWEKIYQHSFIVRAYVHGILKMDFSLLTSKEMKNKKLKAVSAYAELFNEVNENHNLVVILQPYARQYSQGNQIINEVMQYNYLELLEKELINKEITTINLNKDLQQIINKNNYLDYSWKIDGHYNSNGYLLLAETLAKELQAKNICN